MEQRTVFLYEPGNILVFPGRRPILATVLAATCPAGTVGKVARASLLLEGLERAKCQWSLDEERLDAWQDRYLLSEPTTPSDSLFQITGKRISGGWPHGPAQLRRIAGERGDSL